MKFITEAELLTQLKARLKGKTQAQLSKEIGIQPNWMSMILNGEAHITGKVLRFLGYRKVRQRLFEKI
jgi:transcriptional regulator with XRE-family HTH domain